MFGWKHRKAKEPHETLFLSEIAALDFLKAKACETTPHPYMFSDMFPACELCKGKCTGLKTYTLTPEPGVEFRVCRQCWEMHGRYNGEHDQKLKWANHRIATLELKLELLEKHLGIAFKTTPSTPEKQEYVKVKTTK